MKRKDAAENLHRLHSQIAEQVQQLLDGDQWQQWLSVAARFHTYSLNNTLLIFAQRPEATRVAGYRAWQTLGRQVKKGERGIQILAPVKRRRSIEDSPDDERKGHAYGDDRTPAVHEVVGYRATYVWDSEQTDGDPLPEQPAAQLLAGDAPAGAWAKLATEITAKGYTIERGDCGGANGHTDFKQHVVRVRHDVDDAQAVKTLAHDPATCCYMGVTMTRAGTAAE